MDFWYGVSWVAHIEGPFGLDLFKTGVSTKQWQASVHFLFNLFGFGACSILKISITLVSTALILISL